MMSAILLLIPLAIFTASPPPCKNFPLIFGGSAGDTTIQQIDVYSDYLAFGGSIKDSTLTSSSSYLPYVALASVTEINMFFWAQAFSLNPDEEITAV